MQAGRGFAYPGSQPGPEIRGLELEAPPPYTADKVTDHPDPSAPAIQVQAAGGSMPAGVVADYRGPNADRVEPEQAISLHVDGKEREPLPIPGDQPIRTTQPDLHFVSSGQRGESGSRQMTGRQVCRPAERQAVEDVERREGDSREDCEQEHGDRKLRKRSAAAPDGGASRSTIVAGGGARAVTEAGVVGRSQFRLLCLGAPGKGVAPTSSVYQLVGLKDLPFDARDVLFVSILERSPDPTEPLGGTATGTSGYPPMSG